MSRSLLVTGAAGFIGANFVHYWRQTHPQDRIVAYDALTYAGNRANLAALALVVLLPIYAAVRAALAGRWLTLLAATAIFAGSLTRLAELYGPVEEALGVIGGLQRISSIRGPRKAARRRKRSSR